MDRSTQRRKTSKQLNQEQTRETKSIELLRKQNKELEHKLKYQLQGGLQKFIDNEFYRCPSLSHIDIPSLKYTTLTYKIGAEYRNGIITRIRYKELDYNLKTSNILIEYKVEDYIQYEIIATSNIYLLFTQLEEIDIPRFDELMKYQQLKRIEIFLEEKLLQTIELGKSCGHIKPYDIVQVDEKTFYIIGALLGDETQAQKIIFKDYISLKTTPLYN